MRHPYCYHFQCLRGGAGILIAVAVIHSCESSILYKYNEDGRLVSRKLVVLVACEQYFISFVFFCQFSVAG